IQEGRRSACHLGIEERRIAVTQDQTAAIVLANDLPDKLVIALRRHAQELPHDLDPAAAGAQVQHPTLLELGKAGRALRIEVFEQLAPVAAITVPQQLDEALPLAALGL